MLPIGMAANPFVNPKNLTTHKFLCCLRNRTDTVEGLRNGLSAIEVYNKISEGEVVGAEGVDKIRIMHQLVVACERNGYIEREWLWWPWWWRTWSGRIRITPAGIKLCNSIEEDGKSYCSRVPSYKD
jgi:hypothetical protein